MPSLHKIISVVAALYALLLVYQLLSASLQSAASVIARLTSRRRQWHPRTPNDCLLCRASTPVQPVDLVEVIPWKATRSRRGAPQRHNSEGIACQNPSCAYRGCRVATVHAMVLDGVRGKTDRIRRWRCQACGASVTERKHTALYQLKTRPAAIFRAMELLANGLDGSAVARTERRDERTIRRWLSRGGTQAFKLHDLMFRHLKYGFLQLDELVTFLRGDEERVFVWTAVDARSKLIVEMRAGRRLIEDAYTFVHGLSKRIAVDHVPAFSSDGLRHYYSALTAHYGVWQAPLPGKRAQRWQVDGRLLFGMLYKIKVARKLKELYTRVRCGTRKAWQERLTALGFSGKIQTSHVERANLTMREMIAPMARRTWSLARSLETLTVSLEWGRCFYHFCRPHMGLAISRRRWRTPAMAAGLTHEVWSTERVMRYRLP
jgi:IS1 family transposase